MKSKHHHRNNQSSPTPAPAAPANSSLPSADQISAKAYEIYQQQGCQDGHALDHWLQAESGAGTRTNITA